MPARRVTSLDLSSEKNESPDDGAVAGTQPDAPLIMLLAESKSPFWKIKSDVAAPVIVFQLALAVRVPRSRSIAVIVMGPPARLEPDVPSVDPRSTFMLIS